MDPFLALSAAGGLANTVYGIASGIHQNNMAKRINPNRPKYQIPTGIRNNVEIAQNMANDTRLPGQSVAENRIRENTANSLNAVMQGATSGSDILNAASSINKNQNDAFNNLAMQGAQFNVQNKDRLMDANQTLSQYQDQAFDYNRNQPYMMDMARKMALQQSGAANISNGLTGATNLATSFIGQSNIPIGGAQKQGMNPALLNSMYGGVKKGIRNNMYSPSFGGNPSFIDYLNIG